MKIPLSIPAGFPDPSGPLASVPDGPGGIYTPTPGFWTVDYRPDPAGAATPGGMALVEIDPRGVLEGSANLSVQRVVDVELLDDLGDGNGLVTLGILSGGTFVATAVTQQRIASSGDPGRFARQTGVSNQDVNGDGSMDQVVHFDSDEVLANQVVTLHGHDIVLTGETASERIVGIVAGLTLPQAASVPDGDQVPGVPLTIKHTGNPGNIKLSWGRRVPPETPTTPCTRARSESRAAIDRCSAARAARPWPTSLRVRETATTWSCRRIPTAWRAATA